MFVFVSMCECVYLFHHVISSYSCSLNQHQASADMMLASFTAKLYTFISVYSNDIKNSLWLEISVMLLESHDQRLLFAENINKEKHAVANTLLK